MEWTRFSVELGETLPRSLSPITTPKWLSELASPKFFFASPNHLICFILDSNSQLILSFDYSILDKYYVGELVDNEFPVFPEMGSAIIIIIS